MEAARKASDDKRRKLKERIERKMEHADEKREARLSKMQDRIRIHVSPRPTIPAVSTAQGIMARTCSLGQLPQYMSIVSQMSIDHFSSPDRAVGWFVCVCPVHGNF